MGLTATVREPETAREAKTETAAVREAMAAMARETETVREAATAAAD